MSTPAPEAPANDTDQPNESVVETQLGNEQAEQSAAIENDAFNDSDDIDND